MKLKLFLLITAIIFPLSPAISATYPKTGTNCLKEGQIQNYSGKKYTCIRSGKKLIWSTGLPLKPTSVTNSPSPSSTLFSSPISNSTPLSTPTPVTSPKPILTSNCSSVAVTENGKYKIPFQMMNPFKQSNILNGGGFFIRVNSVWDFYEVDISGRTSVLLNSGNYQIQIVPPIRTDYYLIRKDYSLSIGLDGSFSVPNSSLYKGACEVSPGISSAGKDRFSKVSNNRNQSSIAPIVIQKPISTIKYVAPISNVLSNPITLELYPWESEHFVLLTITSEHDPVLISKYLRALDLSYEIYNDVTSNFSKLTPEKSSWSRTINGKAIIAEIPNFDGKDSSKIVSCGGNACTALSTLGIEIRWQILEITLWMLENLDVYDYTLFYELGRTFWPYYSCTSKISLKSNDPTITGFAVLMRYVVLKELKLDIGSEGSESGDEFYTRLVGAEQKYTNQENYDLLKIFSEKILIDGFDGNAIWASLMTYLGNNLGGIFFYKNYFSSCSKLVTPQSDLDAIRNWQALAELASGRNLSSIFKSRWRIP